MQQYNNQSDSLETWFANPKSRIWIAFSLLLIVAALISIINRPAGQTICPLFDDYETTRNETHMALMALGAKGLTEYQVIGGQINVAEKQKATYLSAVKDQGALPKIYDTNEEIKPNPFMLRNQQVQQELNRKKQYVRNMLLRLPAVNEALFEMDSLESGSPFKPDRQSAVVMVTLPKNSVLTSQLVKTIQGIVCGAFAAIEPTQVVVTDANTGISYHDLSDSNQAQLIEMVSWKMQRRQHYLEQLQQLKSIYPDIEINIEISRPELQPPRPIERTDKLAHLTTHKPRTITRKPNEMTLNSGGAVDEFDSRTPKSSQPPQIANVSYETAEIPTLKQPAKIECISPEVIRIEVRVPQQLISEFTPITPTEIDSNSARFALMKAEIIGKIKQIIPPNLLAHSPPIAVYPKLPHTPVADKRLVAIAKWLQIYWPVLGVLIIGLCYGMINRPANTEALATPESEPSNSDEQLEKQLTDLIDSDPEAAANVIQNWIRNAA